LVSCAPDGCGVGSTSIYDPIVQHEPFRESVTICLVNCGEKTTLIYTNDLGRKSSNLLINTGGQGSGSHIHINVGTPGLNDRRLLLEAQGLAETFEVAAGELAQSDKVILAHPTNELQLGGGDRVGHGGVANLSNDDLVAAGGPSGDDPITGRRIILPGDPSDQPGSGIVVVHGNHRVSEIGSRVASGALDPSTKVVFVKG
jgi:hypothetical protein